MTWFKDQQPLALGQRIRGLQGGQKLEILDSQVSGPPWAVWAVGTALPDLTGLGEGGGRCVGVCYNVEVPSPYPKRIYSALQVSWDRPGTTKCWTPAPAISDSLDLEQSLSVPVQALKCWLTKYLSLLWTSIF